MSSWNPPTGGSGSGTVKKVSSANASVTVTTPTGPTVGVQVAKIAPTPATTVTGPDAFGAAAAVGVGTTYARDDHNHGLPAAPTATLAPTGGKLAAKVTVTEGTVATLFTITLVVGKNLIDVAAYCYGIATAVATISLTAGTATYTVTGGSRLTARKLFGASATTGETLVLHALITATVAGTLLVRATNRGAAGTTFTVAVGAPGPGATATGWTRLVV